MSDNYSITPTTNNLQTLKNYEYMLYGGSNYGTKAPSYTNNYVGTTNYNNSYYPYANYYNYNTGYNTSTGQNFNGSIYSNANSNTTNTNFQGLTNEDLQTLINYYNKGLSPSESILSSVGSGAFMAVTNNPRLIAHPWNTLKATKTTSKLFADCKKEGTALYKLWHAKDTNGLIQGAYAAMNKLEARNYSKIGAFRKRYSAEDYQKLKTIMEEALKSGDKTKIADATATLKNAYTTDGWFAKLFKKSPTTVSDAIKDTESISKISTDLVERSNGMSFKQALSKGGGLKGGALMMAVEFLMGIGKINTAFSKDSDTGMKQIGQTTVKAVGNAAGWALGDAAATWALGKAGAKIGSLFGPGIGTLIGAAAGVIGGSIGMCLMGKLSRAIVGQDVADKVETDKLASTVEGQQTIIQNALVKAQNGEKMDAATQHVVQKIANMYA